MQAKIIGKMVEQCMTNHNVVRFWSLGLDKITPWVARVSKIIVRVGSGWPKRPRVGSNLGSGFDPTHPYLNSTVELISIMHLQSLFF